MSRFRSTFYFILVGALLLALNACGGNKDGKFSLAKSVQATDVSSCLAKMKKKKYEDAIRCFEAYRSVNTGSESSAQASLSIGDAYFLKKDWAVAAEAYNLFVEQNPANASVPYAYYRMGQCYLKIAPKNADRDQEQGENAVKALGVVVQSYSSSEYGVQATELYKVALSKLAKKTYNVGRFYYKYNEFLAAIPRFEMVLGEYPQSGYDERSFYYLITALIKVGQKEVAGQYFEVFKQHFADSHYVKALASKL
jgi:outer membrane protein assembly factor BamD